jgi:replication-associated recombination protein RarA
VSASGNPDSGKDAVIGIIARKHAEEYRELSTLRVQVPEIRENSESLEGPFKTSRRALQSMAEILSPLY